MRIFPQRMSDAERNEFIQKAYEKLKISYERFKKPDGKQDYPARTCRDLAVAHPDFENGFSNTYFFHEKNIKNRI